MTVYHRLIIDGNAVYEIDEECARQKQGSEKKRGQMGKEGRYGGRRRPERGNGPQ